MNSSNNNGIFNLTESSLGYTDVLEPLQSLVREWLLNFFSQDDFLSQVSIPFGATAQDGNWTENALFLQESILGGTYSIRLEVLSNNELGESRGAYSPIGTTNEPTIYLNYDWLTTASSEKVQAVLLEELGHDFDHRINGNQDSLGDEGEIFAKLVLNGDPNLEVLQQQNDHQVIDLNGQSVSVETAGSYGIAQIFYLPLPEADIQTSLKAINTAVSGAIKTTIALSATSNGTVVVYDHWEDGYEANLSNPTQNTTQIWGDGDLTNGIAPGTVNDLFNIGQTIVLSNDINTTTPLAIDYDGRDKIGANKAISVTKAGWSATPGTVLAGAIEVYDAGNLGTTYEIPVGVNTVTNNANPGDTANRLFEYTSLHILATQNNTRLLIDKNGDGTTDITVTLNEGQTYLVNGGVSQGATVVAQDATGGTAKKPISVNMITGDIGSSYENRWFALSAKDQWSSSYYAPVATVTTANPAHVFLYNPNATAITIKYDTQGNLGQSITVGPKGSAYVVMPNSAAHFYTADNSKFFAIGTLDSGPTNNQSFDWGYALVPESNLTNKIVVGWGPGNGNTDPKTANNGSPVWVTATADTTLYIDYNGDGTVDTTYNIKALESYRVRDTNDNNQSGLTVFTTDGTLLTAAWGEDPSVAAPGTPYLDMGTTVLPFPDYVFSKVSKEASTVDYGSGVSNNNNLVELSEQIEYKVSVTNKAVIELFNIKVSDSLSPSSSATYVPNSTTLTIIKADGTTQTIAIADDVTGTPFPLSPLNDGYIIGDTDPNTPGIQGLARGDKAILTYRAQVRGDINQALSDANYQITNDASFSGTPAGDTQSITKNVSNSTIVTVTSADGGVFFYNSAFSATVSTYQEGQTIGIRVVDADPNKDTGVAETLIVKVINVTTGEEETVTLTETGTNTGIFQNTLATSILNTNGGSNSGTLQMVQGDSIKVEYVDPIFGSVFDNPTTPGTPTDADGNTATGNANQATATVPVPTKTKVLYLSADAAGGDSTGDLDRIDPVGTNDTTTLSTGLITSGGGSTSISDDFGSGTASYATGTGWSGSWTESNDGTSSPTTGEIQLTTTAGNSGFGLQFGTSSTTSFSASVERSFSAALTSDATLSFKYKNAGMGTTSPQIDTLTIEGWNGSSWYTIGKIEGKNVDGASTGLDNSFTTYSTASSTTVVTNSSAVLNGTSKIRFTYSTNRPSSDKIYIDDVSITSTAVATPATFTQSIPMADAFVIPTGGEIKVVTYISGLSGGTPTSGNVTAALSYGSGNSIITLSSFAYTSLTGTTGYLTWTGTVPSGVTIPSGQAVKLVVTNNQSGLSFKADYDSNTTPSRIELPTTTVINVIDADSNSGNGTQLIGFYNNSFANGGTLLSSNSANAGETVYIRVRVSDPFGDYDITGLTINIDGPGTSGDTSVSLTNANVINPSGDTANDAFKTYEFAWNTVYTTGDYNISIVAQEGYESITASASSTFNVTAQDLGTPSKTEFITALGGAVAGNTYAVNDEAFLRVTDLDENANPTAVETVTAIVNGITVTLTETGNNTGIFEADLSLQNSAFLNLQQGTLLTANYVDNDDAVDTSSDSISVPVPSNTAPVANPNAYTISENATGTGNIITDATADSDANSDTLTVVSVTPAGTSSSMAVSGANTAITLPSGAILTINPDGSYSYNTNNKFDQLGVGQSATETFNYTISDGKGGTATATVTITINGTNDAPVSSPDTGSTPEETPINGNVLLYDTDIDSATLTVTQFTVDTDGNSTQESFTVSAGGSNTATITGKGTLVISSNGDYSFTPVANYHGPIPQVTYTVNDGNGGSATSTLDLTVTPVNDAPSFSTSLNNTPTFVRGGSAIVLDSTVTISDPELDAIDTWNGATLTLVRNGGANSGDSFTNSGTLNSLLEAGNLVVDGTTIGTVTTNSSGRLVLTFNAAATNSLVQSAVQQIAYSNSEVNPAGSVTINYTLNDGNTGSQGTGGALTGTGAIAVTILAPPAVDLDSTDPITTSANNTATFAEVVGSDTGANAVNFTKGAINLSDADSINLANLKVSIDKTTLQSGDQLLLGATSIDITGTSATGTINYGGTTFTYSIVDSGNTRTLTFSKNGGGAAPLVDYETLLDALKYNNTSDTPSGSRSFTVVTNDGTLDSAPALFTVNITAANDLPELDLDANNSSITGFDYKTSFAEGNSAVAIADTDTLITDADDTHIESATIVLTNAKAGDLLSVGSLPSGIVSNVDASVTGQITVTLTGSATKADYDSAIEAITFSNSLDNPDTTDRTITVVVNDGNVNSNTATSTITVVATNDPPAIDLNGAAVGTSYNNLFTENGAAVGIVDNTVATIADPDGTDINTLTLSIAGVQDGNNEKLAIGGKTIALSGSVTDTATIGGTTFAINANNGVVTITKQGGGDIPNADLQTLLRGITYQNTAGTVTIGDRTISIIANDGMVDSNIATSTITVAATPTIAITVSDDTLKIGETSTVTFTLSQASTDFTVDDVAVTGGTLSGFSGSGTTYTATFTPTADSTADGVISVANNKFSNAAGDQNNDGSDANNTATITVDTLRPTIAITSDKSALKAGDTATITFTLSEASTDFDASDIAVTGGTLSNFSGSGTTYTATFTPTADSTADGVIHVDSSKFSDAAGNQNNDGADANNTATLTVDTALPTIAITSDRPSLKAGETATITFTLSESSTDFNASDIGITGGILSGFSGSGTTYTATFTPTADSTADGVIHVDSSKFSDAAGNQNNDGTDANNTATLTVDTLRPTIAITSDKSALKVGETATITFTLSEASTDFDATDIAVTGGTLSGFSGSGTTYTATFTPTTDSTTDGVIHVDSSKFSDAAGNQNNDGADANNTATLTVDTLKPTIVITSDKSALKAGDTATITFTLSEASTDFEATDIAVTGGTLSGFSGSGTTYTVTFTPTADSTADGVIHVDGSKFSDAAGNQNNDGADANNTATLTVDTLRPTIAITADKPALKAGDTATITFTLSESSTDFDISDVVVSGGTLSNFMGSGTTYTATFTPTADSAADGVIHVDSSKFSDAAGNQNNDGADANNTATLTVDTLRPTIAITADKSALKAGDTATITFTLSEASTDFDVSDVVVTGGTLSNFSGSGTTYTATFTPTTGSTADGVIHVDSSKFSDAAGNQNNDGADANNTATLTVDTVLPTIAITSDKSALKAGDTATITFTLSESSTDFDATDIVVTGGTLSNFSGSGTTYTATFTPTADSTANGTIHVDSSKFSDAAGNQNNDGADANNTATLTIDTVLPTITVVIQDGGDELLNDAEDNAVTINGTSTAEVGQIITLSISDGINPAITTTATVQAGGTYSATGIDLSGLNNGTLTVTASVSDQAGNAAIPATDTTTLDNVLPTIAITADKPALKAGDTATITFTLSESSTDFDASDIGVTGGTLSNFSGSGTTYTATFTPTAGSTADGVIHVDSSKFSDAAGNQNNDGADTNNTTTLTVDAVLPTIAITSDKPALKAGETATITFTLSESSTDFDASDIAVTGGTLSNFSGSGTTYTATFTPTADSTADGVIHVDSSKFSDTAGNQNNDGADANNTASLSIDTVLPTIAITSDKPALKAGDTATLTFTLSESSTDFDATDIAVTGGTLSNFSGSGTTYTATFTPTADSTADGVIHVDSSKFSDTAGNQNNDGADANNTATLTVDTVLPTIAITSDKSTLKAGETATITFTLSEASSDFDAGDIDVTGGTLSNFSGSGTTYTATFTPTVDSTTDGVIHVDSSKFSDAAGNQNNDGADANNTATLTVDTVLPTIAITSDKSNLKTGETATLTFILSESSTDFDATDIVVTGGTLSNFSGSGTTYTATFTPTADSTADGVIHVDSSKFSDAAGNQNNDGTDTNNTATLAVDTLRPTIAITSDKSALKAGDTATLTFTLSEASTNFDASDIGVTGGTLSNFSGSGTTYTATFTPTADSTADGVIHVDSSKFSDAAGNQNNDGADANNTATLTVDTVLPTIAITSDKSALKAGDTATITFTLSESSTDFDATDIVVTGGTLSNFSGSGTTYTATFTPTTSSTANGTIHVDSSKFSDAAGNQNNDGTDTNNTATLTVDTVLPTIAITSDKSALKAGETATLTFTLSESSTDFDASDIAVTGGTLSNFSGSGTTYTATFTPTADSTTDGTVHVDSSKFSDAAGNQNNDGADANNTATLTVDTLRPTIAITSDKPALKAGESATITFTLSESSTDFDATDISVTGGTLSNFSGSGTTYTATFTPTADSTADGVIHVDSSKFSDTAGNQNNDGADTNNTATLTVDTVLPTIAITSNKSNLKASDTATITFTLSESSTDFDGSDITVTGGTLSNFSGSGTTYTATFTPTADSTADGEIHVDSSKFSDAAGNQNNDGADTNNTATLTVDTVLPTIAITSDKSALKAGETATITFTLSESSTDFDATDIAVTGGTLSGFSGSGTTYTATFTPTADSAVDGVIHVDSSKFSDAAGNQNNDGADANNTATLTVDTVLPTLAITSDKSSLKGGDTATITFTLSESSTDFDASDITVTGGTLSNFSGSGTTYTATFTPTVGSTADGVIHVDSNKFSDAAGNQNNDGADANNTATLTVDAIRPTVAITSDKPNLKAGDTATITFTLSEAATDFDASDITVTGGTLSNFTGSGTTYTATFTPTADSNADGIIHVDSSKFSDAAGNQNNDGADADNTVTLTVNTLRPTIAITSDKSALKAGDTATITFTLSESSTDFDATDIVVSGGTLTNFSGSGTTYTATFTPTASSTTDGVISVASDQFSNAAGNQNNDGADADNTATLSIDTVLPTIAITSDQSALKAGETATITFTLSEASTDFDETDIAVTGGTLSNFLGKGTIYTATFTPTADSTTDGVIHVDSSKFSDAAGNQNNDGADADNTATLSIDTVLPTIAITSDKPALKVGETAIITFTLSETSADFDASDIVVSGGTLSDFTGSGTTYTAKFTPTANSNANGLISVASNKFSDADGNQNNDGADADNTVTLAIDTSKPSIAINPIAIDDIIDALEDDSPVTIGGTTTGVENGQLVTIVLNGNTYNAPVTNNSWTFDISPTEAQALDPSETVTANVQDLAGNSAIPATRTISHNSLDTDGDGIPDLNDLDDDNDGITDLDELSGDVNRDTDDDGIIDSLDLDSDNDGIPDVKEGGGTDLNGDGIIDNFIDQNQDGLSDRLDPNLGGTPLPLFDTDRDGKRDFQDLDSDNDGILDVIEANGSDPDGDGVIGVGTPTDADGNGLPDVVDPKQNGNPLPIPDTDGDQVPDYRDLDSDNDSIPDVIEAGGSDPDRDGIIGNGTPVDANQNGIADSIDRTIGGNPLNPPDQDGDRIPNYRDLDSDNDGILDIQEYGNQSFDQNGDGVVDGSDQDRDGLIDSIDGNPSGFGSAGKPLPANPDRNSNGIADYLEPPRRAVASQGSDRVTDSDGNDILNGFSDLDILSGGRGDDIINGGSDKDILRGDEGNDTINGGSNNDDMEGGTGNDILNGGTGNDRMLGNEGDDILNGGRGKDYLDGGQGNDRITGNEENDLLLGGEGNDRLIGDRGNDRIVGGFGKDKITGGQGRDKYIYTAVDDLGDVVTDFEILKDRFDLRPLFKASGGSMQDVRFKQQGNNTLVQVDVVGWRDLALLQDVNADTLGSRHFKF